MEWLIESRLPLGVRLEDTAPEGGCKTMFGCHRAVCIASGSDELGHKVKQGPVLIVDMETPLVALENWLNRFSQGLGFRSYHDLPIHIYKGTFEFDRKTEHHKLLAEVGKLRPVFIRFDSLISMLPLGLQGIHENSPQLGGILGRDLNEILAKTPCSTQLAVHSKKHVAELSLADMEKAQLQTLVRGHGSIVGEGSDVGIIIKKLNEHPAPTRFAVISRVRRLPIPDHGTMLVELEEERYGEGWARLREIPPGELPPSRYAKDVYKIIRDGRPDVTSRSIRYNLAFFNTAECVTGISELLEHKVILNGDKAQTYRLNPDRFRESPASYLRELT